jgi:beta-galactosidase
MLTASCSAVGALLLTPEELAARESTSPEGGTVNSARRLDSGWQFRRGEYGGIDEVWRSEGDDLWRATDLPHCFNGEDACDPDTGYFRGQGWYRMRIQVANPFAGGRTLLHFQGAGQTTRAWVNSILVGSHKGGYDEFAFDITDAVKGSTGPAVERGVPITVCCDNAPDRDRVPSELSDFCLYGGLYRHVNLAYLPQIGLEAVHVLPTVLADGSATATVKARLYNPTGAAHVCKVGVRVTDPGGRPVHDEDQSLDAWTGMRQIAAFRVERPMMWSPESPFLYRVEVTLSIPSGEMEAVERFGIRTIEFVEHGPFLLNGKRVLLKGTHRHADHAGVAAAMTDETVRAEMRLIKEMGANFIRLAHYQQDRLVLELCDELGLMVWEEAPWCRAGVGSEAFKQNAREALERMIDQHYNHPSIVLWGLGNEDDWPNEYPSVDQQAIRGFTTEMRDLARGLDDSRLTSFRRCDFARDIPDVYSPSIWAGWYRGNYREYEQSLATERGRVKRLIHIEWGADSHAGRHSEDPEAVLRKVKTGQGTDERGLDYLREGGDVRASRDGDWSETYACNVFDWHLKTQEKLDWLTGSAQWVFKDFASPLRGDNGIPRVNQKGVVERDLAKKESYFVFQSYWAEKPMVRIYGHTWPIRWGARGETRPVHVYSNCEWAELFLNGVSLGKKRRDSQDFPAAGLRWDAEFKAGPNHLRAIAIKGRTEVRDELEFEYQTDTWGTPEVIRLTEAAREGNRVTVEVRVVDARRVRCLDAAHLVKFSAAGAGKLVDNLGTSRGSREVQLANGRAQISMICTGGIRRGGCTVQAEIDGLTRASIEV